MPVPKFDEAAFQQWFAPTAKQLRISPNADDPESYYNYRDFYKAMKAGKYRSPTEPGQHWPSEFKDPNHPRRYLTDPVNQRYFDTESGKYTGGDKSFVNEQRMQGLNAIETPDLPKAEGPARTGADKAVPDYKAIGEKLTMPSTSPLQEQPAYKKDENYIAKLFGL
jgi:hypothetical protein